MNLCPQCRIWVVCPEDIHCAWCGHRLISVEARLPQSVFLRGELPPPLDLELKNRSEGAAITVQRVEASEPWIRLDAGAAHLPFTLGPGSTAAVTVRLETASLHDDYYSGSIVIQSSVGEERVMVELTPAPELAITSFSSDTFRNPCRFDILLDNRNLERNILRLELKRGVVTIVNLSTDQPGWAKIRPAAGPRLPYVMDARRQQWLEVMIDIDEAYLIGTASTYPFERTFNLVLECANFTHQEPVTVTCWRPPFLWIWEDGKTAVDAYEGQPSELTLTVQNSMPGKPEGAVGRAPLEISRVEVMDAAGHPCEWLEPLEPAADIIRVEGGQKRQIRYGFLPQAGMQNPGLGEHTVTFVLTTNLPEVTRRLSLEVRVLPVQAFEGILAIDFGTSNTCCALLPDGLQEYHLVRVDDPHHNANPTTTPTVIHYKDGDENQPQTEIGAGIDALPLSARMLRSTARSLKRLLGEKHPLPIRFYGSDAMVRYLPKQVVTHYLEHVRKMAERDYRGAYFHRIVLTHPSGFKLNQILELEEAVRQAFGADAQIQTLAEPVAAALGFITSEEALKKDHYALGVLDFGGGTTDLSIIEVDNRRQTGFLEIHPRQKMFTGRWFGGEDVTRFVFQAGVKRCREILEADRKTGRLLVDPEHLEDGNMVQTAIQNRGRLLQWAELTKLLLLEYGDNYGTHMPVRPDLFPLHLALWEDNRTVEVTFPHDRITPKRKELDDFLRAELEHTADDIQGLMTKSKTPGLDFIRLSGKSSRIPLVEEVLKRRFPNAGIRRAAEPKECVVEGACIPGKFKRAARIRLVLEEAEFVQTTSRIGYEEVVAGGRTKFCELINQGTPVPEGGISRSIEDFPLLADSRIDLLENASAIENTIQGNPAITHICTFMLNPGHGLRRNEVLPTRLVLHLSSDFQPALTAYAEGREPLSFVIAKAGATLNQGAA